MGEDVKDMRVEPKDRQLKRVIMTSEELRSLLEYSCSEPTGQTIGKRWRCNLNAFSRPRKAPQWLLCWYAEHRDPSKVWVRRARILVLD
jgi:hypothetical protein